MKKATVFFLTVFLTLLTASFSVYAGGGLPAPVSEELKKEFVPFTIITGETDDFQPQNEYSITFAKEITINAESVKGAKVTLSVTSGKEPDAEPKIYEEIIIGPTRKYIQPVSLELGDNFIKITVEKDGLEPTVVEATIKRKDENILESLQRLIIIPGRIK